MTHRFTRRRFLATTAATSAVLAMPHVSHSQAAGKLNVGFWDHFVPGMGPVISGLCKEWGDREKVEVSVDFITSVGNKTLLTTAAESQARAGHDFLPFAAWDVQAHAENLEPVDDIMNPLIAENGAVNETVKYLGRHNNKWVAVPATSGSQIKGPSTRLDLMKKHAGLDMQEMYPAGSAPKADNWTLETFLKAAEACHKGGVPFGIGLGQTFDSVDTFGAFFHAFGAQFTDSTGKITVKTDKMRQAVEFGRKLAAFLPADAPAWDDTSNNKWMIAGKGAMIMNPPSHWMVAKRDAPQVAEQLWTHGFPSGPNGRYAPFLPWFWGVWSFSKNKSAAKSLLTFLSQRKAVETMVTASGGFDLPSFEKFTTFKTWAEEGPPKGTLYHYPNPHNHQVLSIAATPAPPKIAQQIYAQALPTKMIVRHMTGEPMEKTLAWAESEVEGFMRT
ncbi:putative ABC transporter-binding protein precursor [Variibacter gotjawalensis]|uniref:Putative ABC transporter-binding protein n=1 Tax=Variibacter gotjawalensis TaxID=1333996 RepID=A0A0S3PUL2_9BRAD|nr:extracellular solute-binding protein [Variibacter gotjawalensis]NIK49968.1 ABC-type glycerol-3-phosphate transport system substrate-binding protein [Variibacter gotjawalensis]RZS45967.1 carbohydrate ABC transporter substrate-binding protein (CUT1 family) [Variibacter gotjawalensis]BAT59642.1 putative ABC transporter-binding protein precursor [Variibacter gotjawalensis]